MFTFNKKSHATTILINSYEVITGDQLVVDDLWQQRHAQSNLANVLGQAVNHTDNPLDKALTHYLDVRALSVTAHQPLHEFQFSHQVGVSGTIWHHGLDYPLAIKGIPERVLEYCDMSENERETVMLQLHAMSNAGSYVVALAAGTIQRPIKHISDLKKNEKLSFVGLISLKLGISSTARQSIAAAKDRGISIYFATGLHPVATYYLANQLGIANKPGDVYDARQLDATNTAGLFTLISTTKVFARSNSDQKAEIFHTLKTIDDTTIAVETFDDFKKLLAN